VFCERYLQAGHHVEVQVMADAHGTVWALGERECSLQRRHQKVIEEAPSPLVERVGGDMRARLLAAGRDAAAAVGYRGAGTVEFMARADGQFWFLEMNTRLQVEHPVTECVTGLDLVGLQLDVAQGHPLPGDEPATTGWSIEARLYAEDPAAGWTPRSGTLGTFEVPDVTARFDRLPAHGIRLDSGVAAGSVVGAHYDAMLAKVISHAPTRAAAARLLAATLRRSRIHGIETNRDLLVDTLLHPDFLDGTADTSFYARHHPTELTAGCGLDPSVGALVAALSDAAAARATSGVLAGIASGFRNVPTGFRTRTYAVAGRELRVAYRFTREGVEVQHPPEGGPVRCVEASADHVVLDLDGVRRRFAVARFGGADDSGDAASVAVDSAQGSLVLAAVPRFVDPATRVAGGALVAPMPGTIVRIGVEVGGAVSAGQPLLWLEAMKMEHAVAAPAAGTVTDIRVAVGQQVDQGTTLAVVDSEEDGNE
jgi:propionyl-CoA carboxylase alpha chain